MKKRFLFYKNARKWNKILKQFKNLYKRIVSGSLSELQHARLLAKMNMLYKRLERMQYNFGVKLAGTSIALMLISVNSFADNNISISNIKSFDKKDKMEVVESKGNGDFVSAGKLQADGVDIGVGKTSAPSFADIDGDGDLDLYVGEYYGTIKVFTNDGSGNFSSAGNLQADGADISVGYNATPTFADIDGDGDLDLYVGEYYGSIKVFTNDGGSFSSAGNLQADGADLTVYFPYPTFADVDGDGDLDLYVGELYGGIKTFVNDGSGNFSASGDFQADGAVIDLGYVPTPTFEDIDGDGDLDLYVGEYDNGITIFTNDGSGNFSNSGKFQADGVDLTMLYAAPVFADIDGDGDLDLYVGDAYGAINVYKNNTPTFIEDVVDSELTVYPNPSSSIFNIDLPNEVKTISVVDISGKTIIKKSDKDIKPYVDLSDFKNGIYFINLEMDNKIITTKIVKE